MNKAIEQMEQLIKEVNQDIKTNQTIKEKLVKRFKFLKKILK